MFVLTCSLTDVYWCGTLCLKFNVGYCVPGKGKGTYTYT